MWGDKTVLAVVPARGGSKGIPRKNLCEVGGLSLVARAAKIVKSLPWIDFAVISTDDEEIAKEAMLHGLDAPFMRDEKLSGDFSNSIDVWRDALVNSEKFFQKTVDYSILLEPTSPLRVPQDIEVTISSLISGNHQSAVTVSETPGHYKPEKTLKINNGQLNFYLKEGVNHTIRQSIPSYYHRNGICYAITREALVNNASIIADDCAAVLIDREVINIDTPLDLKVANFLWEFQKS